MYDTAIVHTYVSRGRYVSRPRDYCLDPSPRANISSTKGPFIIEAQGIVPEWGPSESFAFGARCPAGIRLISNADENFNTKHARNNNMAAGPLWRQFIPRSVIFRFMWGGNGVVGKAGSVSGKGWGGARWCTASRPSRSRTNNA